MASVLRHTFHDGTTYLQGRCCRNADELTQKLVGSGVPIEKIKVIYLLYEGYRGRDVPVPREADLTPALPRQGFINYSWPRHVILEVDGKILDLDYKPEPVPPAEYFAKMFPKSYAHPEGNLEPHIRIRVVPAERNRDEFIRQGGDDAKVVGVLGVRQDTLPDYPVQTVANYLTTVP